MYQGEIMKILCVADSKDERLLRPQTLESLKDVEFILSAGDLDLSYLDELYNCYNKSLYFVFGNHQLKYYLDFEGKGLFAKSNFMHKYTHLKSLEGRFVYKNGVILFGLGGCMKYNKDTHQYSEGEMKWIIRKNWWKFLYNKLRYGRYVDILVTHAPPRGIHDDSSDVCHKGFKAFNAFIEKYKPKYHIHGHTHIYDLDMTRETKVNGTIVANAYKHIIIEL